MTELSPPRIVCAAIQSPEDGLIIAGANHFDQIMLDQLDALNRSGLEFKKHQGFIDQHGNYYDRETAYQIALANNQIIRCHDQTGQLFTEHLY